MHFCENEPKMQRSAVSLYPAKENGDRWLVSYTDVLTILLALFIAVAAQGLKQRLSLPTADSPPPAPPSAHKTLLAAEQRLKQHGLDLRLEKRGLVISLPQAVLFPSGDDRVTRCRSSHHFPNRRNVARLPNKVALVGHADSIPIHNQRFKNNWQLSAARSLSLLALLTDRYGIPESRLLVESDGSNDPKNSNDTEAGRAENRRVEILILDDPA